MTDIYIVRHGNTFDKGDTVTRVGARTDLPLSRSGQVQADLLAVHFKETVPHGFSAAFCSELQRTRQTAETILDGYKQRPDLTVLDFLREVDYGPDENQPDDQVIARIGEAALAAWDAHAVPPPGWDVAPDQLIKEWASLLNTLSGPDEWPPVLIVTSNGVARFVLDSIVRFACEPESIKLKTGAYGLIRTGAEGATLLNWNVRP
ncbi:MAG: histidine phosphatase family protein [Hyphomonadaceae bacterium]|nr:histidine phosphatase family protein [Hyphomonadaceae bacterium]